MFAHDDEDDEWNNEDDDEQQAQGYEALLDPDEEM